MEKEPTNTNSKAQGKTLAEMAEDHSLVMVPIEDRKSGLALSMSPVGVATALVIFAIGGFTVILAGFKWGVLAGVAVSVLGIVLGKLLGRMAFETGMSSTLTSRFFGFGFRGSALGSAIFAFMILGFLALESALLYEGTLLMFQWEDTWPVRIALYTVLTLIWIGLAIFGIKLALQASTVLTVVTLAVTFYMIYQIFVLQGADLSTVFNYQGIVPGSGWSKFEAAVALIGGTAGTIALLTTDFARYCRNHNDVSVLAVAGPLVQNVVTVILGALIVVGSLPQIIDYLMARDAGLTVEAATAEAGGFVMGNTGAYYIILAGWLGFITIYAAQAKAQGINAYSGSLALVNLIDALFDKKTSRALMVVIGNILALMMIAADILGQFASWIAYLGCMTLGLCGVMIADYYFVRRMRFNQQSQKVENWNWAGIITLIITAGIGIYLIQAQIWALGFLLTFVLSLIIYPLLRALMPEGTATGYVSDEIALEEAQ